MILGVFKHNGKSGSCIIVTAVNIDMAEQFISHKLDLMGLEDEELCIHEIRYATTQSSIIHIEKGTNDTLLE